MLNHEPEPGTAVAGQTDAPPAVHSAARSPAGRRPNVAGLLAGCLAGWFASSFARSPFAKFLAGAAVTLAVALAGSLPAWAQMPLPMLVQPSAGAPPDWSRIAPPLPRTPSAVPVPPAGWDLPLPFPLTAAPSVEEQPNAEPAVATDARLSGDDKQTRLTIDLSRRIDMRAFTLAGPYRVVIEIPQVNFQLPPGASDQSHGIIKAFRYGLVMSGGSRIVIDLTGPVRVTKAVVLDPADGRTAQMVLDMVAVDRETFLRAAAIDNHLPRARLPDREYQTSDPRPVVVIDAGHGGIDPGTRSPGGELEKNLTLEFATVLRNKLEATGKYRVMMTRSSDTFIELSERVQIAHQQRAQLLISIHCDALARGEGEAEGASVYTLSDKASDAESQHLADAENRADVIGGVDLADEPNEIADILIDLAQRETKAFSANFARNVAKDMSAATRMHKHPLKSAGFRILKAPDVPSVLIELGYVSNARDLKQLVSETWRSRTADAIAHAVQIYFTTRVAGGRAAPNAH
jgi:N-acetylmuramoyl-L-alanine amidase